ncbi:hypothetical protein [Streptomyces europaeiscabiei]|uniref:hypothetical protein n=1 Tax=Streptomyces europaeiscabiei TaxID=146819 RepID=UPI002E15F160|nr:hypothetical protein OHB30_11150 [Streptomyces europaeiscabiei]
MSSEQQAFHPEIEPHLDQLRDVVRNLADDVTAENSAEGTEVQWGQWSNWASWTKVA